MKIDTEDQFQQALDGLVSAHTTQDRTEIIGAVKEVLRGHPRAQQINLLLDGLCCESHNLAGRIAAVEELKGLIQDFSEPEAKADNLLQMPAPETETVHYADGSSATGPGPLPRNSPEGAPAIDGPPQDVPVKEGESAADPETAAILDRGVASQESAEPEKLLTEGEAGQG